MTEAFTIQFADPVVADDCFLAADHAQTQMKAGNVSLLVTDSQGNCNTITMGTSGHTQLFRIIGIDTMASPRSTVISATDIENAQELAPAYGFEKVILCERTMLSDEEESDIRAWVEKSAAELGEKININTTAVFGGGGQIALADNNGKVEFHSYALLGDSENSLLKADALAQVFRMTCTTLLASGKTIEAGPMKGDFALIDGDDVQLKICRDTGKVMGWVASTSAAFQWACNVVMVDIFSVIDDFDDSNIRLETMSYWTRQGEIIPATSRRPKDGIPVLSRRDDFSLAT